MKVKKWIVFVLRRRRDSPDCTDPTTVSASQEHDISKNNLNWSWRSQLFDSGSATIFQKISTVISTRDNQEFHLTTR